MEKPRIRNKKLINPTQDDDAGAWVRAWVSRNIGNYFYCGDIDFYTYKKKTKILRLWEAKWPNERLSPGEREVLEGFDYLIKLGIANGKYAKGSGVFIIRIMDKTLDITGFIIENLKGKSKEISLEEAMKIIGGDK